MITSLTKRQALFLIPATVAVFVTACGGGGGGGTEPDLSAAYEAVTQGMSYAQVRDLVGFEFNAGKNEAPSEVTYSWTDKPSTAATQFLSVAFNSEDQAVFKVIQVKGGRTSSQSWK